MSYEQKEQEVPDDVQRHIFVANLKNKMEDVTENMVNEFRSQLGVITETYVNNVQQTSPTSSANGNVVNKRCRKSPGKQFSARDSLLTELFKISHIKTIYHIFIAMLALLLTHSMLTDLVERGTVNVGFELITFAFGGVRQTLEIWSLMFISVVFLVYPSFHFWAHHRNSHPAVMDIVFSSMLVLYFSALLVLPAMKVIESQLPPACSFAVILEQVRLAMKVYAFVRSNVWRARAADTPEKERCPDFNKFIYFLFVPTLVYRDAYPRTSCIHWRRVVLHLAQVVGSVIYTNFLLDRFILAPFRSIGHQPMSASQLLVHLISIIMPAMFCYLAAFFGLLHAWMNAFAEMTRFADRLFYQDWWNATNFASFYRTWNIVVHDWLYEYIFLDLVAIQGKLVATIAVFSVSALVHEYVLMVVFRFFFPLLFIQFGLFGTWIYFLNLRGAFGNIMLWMCLSFGVGMDFCFYAAEWYSRVNCDSVHEDVFWNFLTSHAWSCTVTNSSSGAV